MSVTNNHTHDTCYSFIKRSTRQYFYVDSEMGQNGKGKGRNGKGRNGTGAKWHRGEMAQGRNGTGAKWQSAKWEWGHMAKGEMGRNLGRNGETGRGEMGSHPESHPPIADRYKIYPPPIAEQCIPFCRQRGHSPFIRIALPSSLMLWLEVVPSDGIGILPLICAWPPRGCTI
jgi:hypothetical protein